MAVLRSYSFVLTFDNMYMNCENNQTLKIAGDFYTDVFLTKTEFSCIHELMEQEQLSDRGNGSAP